MWGETEGEMLVIDRQVADTLSGFSMALWEVAGVGIHLRNFPEKDLSSC